MQDNLIQYSFRSTQFYTHPKFVHQKLIESQKQAEVEERSGEFVKIYLNPSALSYHNMDNILPLDQKICQTIDLRFQCIPFEYLTTDVLTSQVKSDTNFLVQLHNMNLYQPKFEGKSYRGGKRFIFRSDTLAKLMYSGLKNVLPIEFRNQFHSVNPVFRYNCFEPSDNDFEEHHDIAFTDLVNNLRSPLLVYLTGGQNQQTLKIQDFQIDKLVPNQIIIMDQSLKHSGKPYKAGNKIFIRTDLIYKVDGTEQYDQQQARLFNTGCYMSKEGLIDQELLRYSTQCFAKSNLLRYALQSNEKLTRIFLHKQITFYLNQQNYTLQYFADGSSYYFCAQCDLQVAFAATIYDYFRGPQKILDKYYFEEGDDFQQHFNQFFGNTRLINENVLSKLNRDKLLNKQIFMINQEYLYQNIKQISRCSQCSSETVDQQMVEKVQEQFKCYMQIEQSGKYSMVLSNSIILLNINDMQITDKQIFFQNTGTFNNFNYAACQCGGLNYEQHLQQYHMGLRQRYLYNLPSVTYIRSQSLLNLSLDLFKNGFVVRSQKKKGVESQINELQGF